MYLKRCFPDLLSKLQLLQTFSCSNLRAYFIFFWKGDGLFCVVQENYTMNRSTMLIVRAYFILRSILHILSNKPIYYAQIYSIFRISGGKSHILAILLGSWPCSPNLLNPILLRHFLKTMDLKWWEYSPFVWDNYYHSNKRSIILILGGLFLENTWATSKVKKEV